MDLSTYEVAYFNQQIKLAVQSLGFDDEDTDFTLTALDTVFGKKCSPPTTVIPPSAGLQLQSVCLGLDCPLDQNATCSAYPDDGDVASPAIANATLIGNITKESDGRQRT